jgi:hypothetical protein
LKKILLALSVCVLFSACGKNKNNDPFVNNDQAAKDRDLQGKNFASPCSVSALDAILTGILTGGTAAIQAEQIVYRFDGANVTRTTHLYTNTSCTGDTAVSFVETGDVSLRPDTRTNDGGKYIDIDYKNLQVTTVTDDGVKAANAIHLCGATDWSANSKRDETAQAKDVLCYGAALPRHNSNVYRVDANVLYFGAQTKADNNDSERPGSLDFGTKYTQQ